MTIIFDLDGTLIDSREVMIAAFREAYAEAVGPGVAPVSGFLQLTGESFPNILRALGLPEEMSESFIEASRRRLGQVRLHESVSDVCRSLEGRVPLAILTGKDRTRTNEILDHFEIRELFSVIATGSDGFTPKPSSAGILWICEKLNSSPLEACLVGDGPSDMVAAHQAGAWSIGCSWGIGDYESIRRAGAREVVSDAFELNLALERWIAHVQETCRRR